MRTVSMQAHRRRIRAVAVLAAAVLALAACGGGTKTTTAAGGPTSSTPAGADGSAEADTSGVAAGSPEATTTTAGATATTRQGSKPAASAPVANVVDDTPGLPAAGRYSFKTTGTSKFGANPSQPVDTVSVTTLEHLGGGLVRQSSEDQTSELQWSGAQVLLRTLDFTRPGFERHFEAKPPVMYAPVQPKVGDTWTWTLTAKDFPTTVKQDSRVDRREMVTVSGKKLDAVVVVTKITLSGDVSGTIDLTQWVDTATNLPARIYAKTNIVTFTFTSETTSDLTGFQPA